MYRKNIYMRDEYKNIYVYTKIIFVMKNKFRQQLRTQQKLVYQINLNCCIFKFVFKPINSDFE